MRPGVRIATRRTWPRWVFLIVLTTMFVVGVVQVGERLTSPPRTQAEAEAQLDRQVIAYALWEDTPYVVFEFGGSVHFDRLRIDLISIEWPPTPRWQWTGMWWTIHATNEPASVALASTGDPVPHDPYRYAAGSTPDDGAGDARVIFGQANDPAITELQIEIDGVWQSYPVAAPGFAVRLPTESSRPSTARWLNADGAVIWTSPVQDG